MKYAFLIIAFSGLALGLTFSGIKAQGFDIGVRAGANLSYYHENSANPPPNSSAPMSEVGFVGGIQGDYWFNTAWAISSQILYAEKKATFNIESFSRGVARLLSSSISHTYIEIPLELKLRILSNASLRPYLFSGITVGFLSSEKKGSFLYSSLPDDPLLTSIIDFGVIGGVGLDYVFSSGTSLFIDIGYRVGLINLNNTVSNSTVNDLRFCTGLVFPL